MLPGVLALQYFSVKGEREKGKGLNLSLNLFPDHSRGEEYLSEKYYDVLVIPNQPI